MIRVVWFVLFTHGIPRLFRCPNDVLVRAGSPLMSSVRAEIFGKQPIRGPGPDQVTDTLRAVSKTLTLGISYCLGPRSFVRLVEIATRPEAGGSGMMLEMEETKEFYAKFFAMFPDIAANQQRAESDAQYEDCVYTITCQRRFLPPLKNDLDEYTGYWPSLQLRKRVLVNTPIQGSAPICISEAGAAIQATYRQAEGEARAQKRGLWSDHTRAGCAVAVSPS